MLGGTVTERPVFAGYFRDDDHDVLAPHPGVGVQPFGDGRHDRPLEFYRLAREQRL